MIRRALASCVIGLGAVLVGCGASDGSEDLGTTSASLTPPIGSVRCDLIAGIDARGISGLLGTLMFGVTSTDKTPSVLAFEQAVTGTPTPPPFLAFGAVIPGSRPIPTAGTYLAIDVSQMDLAAMTVLANDPANQAAPILSGLYACGFDQGGRVAGSRPAPYVPEYIMAFDPGACGHGCS